MKRNRLPNHDKREVLRALCSFFIECGATSQDALRISENGNPSMHQRVCRWIAADPLYRRVGLCREVFRRAFLNWVAVKAGYPFAGLVSIEEREVTEESVKENEEYENDKPF